MSFSNLVGGNKTSGSALGFSGSTLTNDVFCLLLYRGPDADGEMGYAYIAVHYARLDAFRKALDDDEPMDFRDYGIIIHSGAGDIPTETALWMEEKYGFEHRNYLTVPE